MKAINNIKLFFPIIILNIISLLNMFNARLISDNYSNAFYKQLIWIILGYLLIILIKKININSIIKYSKYLYILSIILLIIVLMIGKSINGSKCWLSIFGISFQPSELCKLSLSLYLIYIINKSKCSSWKKELILISKVLILTIIPSILVFLEPDTGAIINYFLILVIILFSIKLNKWWNIVSFFILLLLTSTFFIMYFFYQDYLINILGTSLFYRMDRIMNFTNGLSYQLENALITIGNASLLSFNINKIILYIPEAPTDFIFAFSIGNYGLLTGLLIIISFILIDIYFFNLIKKSNNKIVKIFIVIYLAILLFHEYYNIFMNIGLLPIMGIPLPFVSYGGTNTLMNYIYIGLIINMSNKKTTLL